MKHTVAEMARIGHGAIQVEEDDQDEALIVFLAGPIKAWWQPGAWDSPAHRAYTEWRDAVEAAFVRAGCLVYKPYGALRGRWTERAQAFNDAVIREADLFVDLTPRGVIAEGTAAERRVAEAAGVTILPAGPGQPVIEHGFDDAVDADEWLRLVLKTAHDVDVAVAAIRAAVTE